MVRDDFRNGGGVGGLYSGGSYYGLYTGGGNGQSFVNPNDDEYASKTYANIIRGEYRDYQNRFQPYEDRLMSLADSRELLDQQLSRITTNVNASFKNSHLGASSLMQQRYGVANSNQMQAKNAKQTEINRAMSIAHAKNNTRVANADRQMGIVTGSNTARNNAMNYAQGG